MAELAQALGMKVSIVAYDDGDHKNARGPIDPEVFVNDDVPHIAHIVPGDIG